MAVVKEFKVKGADGISCWEEDLKLYDDGTLIGGSIDDGPAGGGCDFSPEQNLSWIIKHIDYLASKYPEIYVEVYDHIKNNQNPYYIYLAEHCKNKNNAYVRKLRIIK